MEGWSLHPANPVEETLESNSTTSQPALEELERRMRQHATAVVSRQRAEQPGADEAATRRMVAFLKDKRYGVMAVTARVREQDPAASPGQPWPVAYFVLNQKVAGDDGGELEQDTLAVADLFDHDNILSLRIGAPAMLIGTSRRQSVVPAFGQRRAIQDITPASRTQDVLAAMHGRHFVVDGAQELACPDSLFGIWGLKAVARNVRQRLHKA
jgi:hypothetical protein